MAKKKSDKKSSDKKSAPKKSTKPKKVQEINPGFEVKKLSKSDYFFGLIKKAFGYE